MAIHLDPQEVLAHLNEMGYRDITTEQLHDFIKDLKKLIKYDIQKCRCGSRKVDCTTCTEESNESPKDQPRLPLSTTNNTSLKKTDFQKSKVCSGINRKCTDDEGRDKAASEYKFNHEVKKTLKGNKVKFDKENKPETSDANRPKSSFIRPWQLHSGSLTTRCDPVTLYHKYQALWRQQKVPGEDSHSELRWRIREKMLGQDPHPRPVSQASSVESLYRRHKK